MISQMGRGMGRMFFSNMGTELIYSFVIIVCSLMIYFATKEIYNLTKYKGIKYFRLAFLFFAFAYFSRSFIKFIVFYFNSTSLFSISPKNLSPLISSFSLFLFTYFSTISIFYLFYSVLWKKIEKIKFVETFIHTLAIFFSLVIILSRNILLYFLLNLFLLLLIIFLVFFLRKNSKNKKQNIKMYSIYVLLSFFWILNVTDIFLPKFFQTTQLLIYLASSFLFLFILYKVLRDIGN